MNRYLTLAGATLCMAACATGPSTQMVAGYEVQDETVTVLLMPLDVEMNFLTTSGIELRADWSETAASNLSNSVSRILAGSKDEVVVYDAELTGSTDETQTMLLFDAVMESMLLHRGVVGSNIPVSPLPNRAGSEFEYNLGEGMQVLGEAYDADYALFISSNGQFQSSGVVFRNLLITAATAAASGGSYIYVPITTDVKGTFMSLVELETGKIVWVNGHGIGDPRNPDEALEIAIEVMRTNPVVRTVSTSAE